MPHPIARRMASEIGRWSTASVRLPLVAESRSSWRGRNPVNCRRGPSVPSGGAIAWDDYVYIRAWSDTDGVSRIRQDPMAVVRVDQDLVAIAQKQSRSNGSGHRALPLRRLAGCRDPDIFGPHGDLALLPHSERPAHSPPHDDRHPCWTRGALLGRAPDETIGRVIDPARFPLVAAAFDAVREPPLTDDARADFEFGLAMIIDGVQLMVSRSD